MSDQAQASASTTSPIANQSNDSSSASASVAQTNVAGDGLKCEWKGCGESLPNPGALYDHICESHVGRKSTNNLNLTCAWGTCQTTTVKRDHITSHIRVHVPLKPHKCDFCSKSFKRPQDLKKHVKTHAEDTGYHNSPEPNRGGHGGGAGGYGGSNKHGVADLQHMAATATGYYGDHHGISGQPGVYQPYSNGSANPSAYHGPGANYQANYATTFYPLPGPSSHAMSDYEVRKRATFDALNEFFGDIKSRPNLDSNQYHAVTQRLMSLQNLPGYLTGQEYGSGPAVAAAAHQPLNQHYTLPMSNIRTKNDLQNIDQFLEQLQAQVYEHENNAAAAGVAQPGVHTVPVGLGYRSSHSPPHAVQTSSHALPPLTSSAANDTPALTPASSVVSYNSPGSVHSSAISPVSRASVGGSIYPTLPSVSTVGEAIGSYAATSSALPSALGPSFDSDGRRRYSGGTLQRSAPNRDSSSSPDTLPQIDKLGVRSPSLSNVDPALYGEGDKTPRARSPADSDIAEGTGNEVAFVDKLRIIEALRDLVQERLKRGEFEDKDQDVKNEDEADRTQLYPVLRSLQEAD